MRMSCEVDLTRLLSSLRGDHNSIRILLDFSGTEAPLWAAQELGISFTHVASCDAACGPQKFCLRNFQPGRFFNDVFGRSAEDLVALRIGAATAITSCHQWLHCSAAAHLMLALLLQVSVRCLRGWLPV
jgi:hypothetical protein